MGAVLVLNWVYSNWAADGTSVFLKSFPGLVHNLGRFGEQLDLVVGRIADFASDMN